MKGQETTIDRGKTMFRLQLVLFALFVGLTGCLAIHHAGPNDNLHVNGTAGPTAAVGVMDAATRNTAVEAGIARCAQLVAEMQAGQLPPGSVVTCNDAAGGFYSGPLNTWSGYYNSGYNGYGGGYGYTGPLPPRTAAAQQYSALYQQAETAKRQLEASERQRLEAEIQLRRTQEEAARRAAEQSANND